jgi:Glycosyl transferase family 2
LTVNGICNTEVIRVQGPDGRPTRSSSPPLPGGTGSGDILPDEFEAAYPQRQETEAAWKSNEPSLYETRYGSHLMSASPRGHRLSPTDVLNRPAESDARGHAFAEADPTSGGREPLVSVIIPAFNHGRFVRQCLDSVADDDYSNKEIVIIDDGSVDGTLAVIESWADEPRAEIPILVVSRPNRGITRTLNELLHKARGQLGLSIANDGYRLLGGVRALVEVR